MADMDLIPESYRRRVRARAAVRNLGAALFILLLGSAAVFAGLRWQLGLEKRQLGIAAAQAQRVNELRKQVESLQQDKRRLMARTEALAALAGEGEASVALQAIDRSLNQGVWLSSLRFHRSQQQVETGKDQSATEKGAQVRVVRAPDREQVEQVEQKVQAWQLSTHLELGGGAADHSALADFLKLLDQQPGVTRVRLMNSQARGPDAAHAVDFSAGAVLWTEGTP